MKQETKELIDWIKKQISLAGTIVTDISHLCWQQDCDKAIKFLDSLPEIEEKLCFGGYIQDRNGTPCCDGDKVVLTTIGNVAGQTEKKKTTEIGTLIWNRKIYQFVFETESGFCKIIRSSCSFEKVE